MFLDILNIFLISLIYIKKNYIKKFFLLNKFINYFKSVK